MKRAGGEPLREGGEPLRRCVTHDKSEIQNPTCFHLLASPWPSHPTTAQRSTPHHTALVHAHSCSCPYARLPHEPAGCRLGDCFEHAYKISSPRTCADNAAARGVATPRLVLVCNESRLWMVRARASRSFSMRSYRLRVLPGRGVCGRGQERGKARRAVLPGSFGRTG